MHDFELVCVDKAGFKQLLCIILEYMYITCTPYGTST